MVPAAIEGKFTLTFEIGSLADLEKVQSLLKSCDTSVVIQPLSSVSSPAKEVPVQQAPAARGITPARAATFKRIIELLRTEITEGVFTSRLAKDTVQERSVNDGSLAKSATTVRDALNYGLANGLIEKDSKRHVWYFADLVAKQVQPEQLAMTPSV